MLGGTSKVIADEQGDLGAVRVLDAPDARVGMREVDVAALEEGEAEQPVGDIEGRRDDPLQRQMRLERAFVVIVQRLPALLLVIAPVPRLQFEIAALGGDHRLQRLGVP